MFSKKVAISETTSVTVQIIDADEIVVNHGARKHYQIVFNSVAIDHVLTQINSLYTQGEIPNAVNPDDGILNGHIDLGDPRSAQSYNH